MRFSVFVICLIVLNASTAISETGKAHYYFGAGAPFYNTHELLSESMISLDKLTLYGLRSFDEKIEATTNPWLSAGYRIVRSIGVDLPISIYAAEISHEVFGHGFPSKNYGGNIDSINIGFPPIPYDLDYRSSTRISGANVPADIFEEWSNHQKANGIQVEYSMSHLVKNKFWQTGTVDYDLSILLLKTAYAPGWYALFDSPEAFEEGDVDSSNDIAAIAARYSNESGEHYSAGEIRDRTFLYNSLNPLVLWSWYGVLNYMATGESKTKLPYISVFDVQWLPGLSYSITGYGEEYLLSNYFRTKGGRSGSFEIGLGSVDNEYRASIMVDDLLGGSDSEFDLGAELHYWEQRKTGTAGFIDLNYYLFGSKSTGIHLKVGYKSFGFLRGYGLKKGIIGSFGFVYRL